MSHTVERIEGAMEEFGGKMTCMLAALLRSERLEAEGRAWQTMGRRKQSEALRAEHDEGAARVVARVSEVSGIPPAQPDNDVPSN